MITRQADFAAEGVKVVGSMDAAMVAAADADAKEIYVIGGGEIYKQALPIAHRVYITRVHTVVDGDTFFPELPTIDWKLLSRLDFKADAKHAYDYSFEVWERIPQ